MGRKNGYLGIKVARPNSMSAALLPPSVFSTSQNTQNGNQGGITYAQNSYS